MAPFIPSAEITDLNLSSLELDSRTATTNAPLSSLLKRNDLDSLQSTPSNSYNKLTARDSAVTATGTPNYGGAIDPTAFNNKGVQAVFALIGVSFVLGAIWFFFWAKNGGFKWQKNDWEDYKSTVLRRKGPNGTTLSNATKSTRLGGGSVVGEGYSDDGASTVSGTMTATMTELSSEAPIIKEKQRQQSRAKKESAKERKLREAKGAQWEGGHDQDVRAYRHERPARVGGINKDSDALHYGTDYTETEPSVTISSHRPSRQQQPRQPSSRHASPEKRSTRRDFSYGNDAAFSNVSSNVSPQRESRSREQAAQPAGPAHRAPPGRYHSPSKQPAANENRRSTQQQPSSRQQNVPGAFHHEVTDDVQSQNTKSYHHPLPTLNNQARGYRRDRRDSLDD